MGLFWNFLPRKYIFFNATVLTINIYFYVIRDEGEALSWHKGDNSLCDYSFAMKGNLNLVTSSLFTFKDEFINYSGFYVKVVVYNEIRRQKQGIFVFIFILMVLFCIAI